MRFDEGPLDIRQITGIGFLLYHIPRIRLLEQLFKPLLKDLGKGLPRYEEIALPVEMDADTYEQYDRTRSLLKDYLISRKWEGDSSFRAAYLQWALGWPSAMFRPTEVIHNIRSSITNERRPHTVTKIPSFGEDRVYAKEQALIDLLAEELKNERGASKSSGRLKT